MHHGHGSWSRLLCFSLVTVTLLVGHCMPKASAQDEPVPPEATNSASPTEPINPAAPATAPPNSSESTQGPAGMRMGIGDLLEVSVYGVPELTAKARISNTGDIYLPLINSVHVAGLTAEEAQTLIEKRLEAGAFVKNPHVSVFIADYASEGVNVLGQVTKPGVYTVVGERRLFDVISAAGGFTERAGRTVSITHRNALDTPVMVKLSEDLKQNPENNLRIQPGDTVVVHKAGVVYVVGDVGRAAGFAMDSDNFTVLKVLALAGGPTKTAKLNSSKIIRKTPQGTQQTEIPLKKILQAKAPDVSMYAEDILFVPSSVGKVAAYRGAEAVMQAATALSIVAIRP